MATTIATFESPALTYRMVLLLTGDARHAERVMCDAVQHEPSLWDAVAEAMEYEPGEDVAAPELPPQLRDVMSLPRKLRHCFVLRILEGMPADRCAQLLRLSPQEVNAAASHAAQTLASA